MTFVGIEVCAFMLTAKLVNMNSTLTLAQLKYHFIMIYVFLIEHDNEIMISMPIYVI